MHDFYMCLFETLALVTLSHSRTDQPNSKPFDPERVPLLPAGAFPQLSMLILSQNQLTGSLPSTLPTHIQVLDTSHNQLTSSIPAGWATPNSTPELQQLYLFNNQLSGSLPSIWPSHLQLLQVNSNSFVGKLPDALGTLQRLQAVALGNNAFTGDLPAAWGATDAFPQLLYLDCNRLGISGDLPSAWGSPTAFQRLENMFLFGTNVSGFLPDSWAAGGAFPRLKELQLSSTFLHGSIPASWTSANAFPWLQALHTANTNLSGFVPAFHNRNLSVVEMDDSLFSGDLSTFWNSTAPLIAASLSGNSISGYLPDHPATLDQLTFLNLDRNLLQGTVPLSWLHSGEFLSHITFLNVGKVWRKSVTLNSWRQTLCLEMDLYDADVTGQQLLQIPELVGGLSTHELDPNHATFTDWTSWVQNNSNVTADIVLQLLQLYRNQLASVQVLCANPNSPKLMLALWLTFVGCCVVIVSAYMLLRHRPVLKPSFSARLPQSALLVRVSKLAHIMLKTVYALGGLVFYYYDLVTSITVLVQVWGTWPAAVLLTILLVHFAAAGAVVSFQTLTRMPYLSGNSFCSKWVVFLLAIMLSPFVIPLVLLLDTLAFVHDMMVCLEMVVKLETWHCLQGMYSCAHKFHDRFNSFGTVSLGWVDLENYERMHNTVAALAQSFPTVVLNSVLFSLGNKPSHGIFLSTGLFLAAIIASYLAILKCLVVVLWQAQKHDINPLSYALHLLAGNMLGGEGPTSAAGVKVQEVQMLTPQPSGAVLLPLGHTDSLAPAYSGVTLLPVGSGDSLIRQSEEYSWPRSRKYCFH